MKRLRWVIVALVFIFVVSFLPLASAKSAQAESGKSHLEELATGADAVVIGTVVELTSYWNDEHTGIFTSAVIAVDENVDNSTAQDSVNVTVLGGEAEGISEWVSDMPSFTQGEKTAVFLKKLEKSQVPKSKFTEARLAEEQYEVYGGYKGKFAANDDRVGNLPVAKFKEAVSKIRRGESSPGVELDASLAVVTMPYSYDGYHWPHPPAPVVNYRINQNTPDTTGEGAAIQNAAETWSSAGAAFSLNYAGTTTCTSYGYNGTNEILWRGLGSGPTIALTHIWYYTDTLHIVENDMEFNEYYLWSTAATPPSNRFDVQTIALHEFGHYLCLEDLCNPADSAKVMYGYGSEGQTKRALHSDDIAGIRYIYGAAATSPTVTNASGASSIATTSARLNGEITSTGGENPTVHIYWGPSDGGTNFGSWAHDANLGVRGVGTFYKDITGLSSSTTYYYRCYAANSGGGSWASGSSSFDTLLAPPPAPALASPANGATVPSLTPHLAWNASSGADDYGIQIATASSFASPIIDDDNITDLFYDVPSGNLNWNTTYYWRVNAHNSIGTSSWSVYRSFKTAVGPPPDPPSNLLATPVSSKQIDLAWQDNSDNEAGFKIERKTGAGGTYALIATVGAGVESYSNTGLIASTEYYYRVRAWNLTGYSGYCDEVPATTLPPPPPRPALKLPAGGATVADLTPRLEWNASAGAASYGIQIATTANFAVPIVDDDNITDLFYDVLPGTLNLNAKYYWRVNARGSSGSTSLWSAYRYFKTPVGPAPDAPSDLLATVVSAVRIDLTWNDNSINESNFKIERKKGIAGTYALIATVGAGVESYSNTGLIASTEYYYRVRVWNPTGYSGYCDEASATTLPPPPPRPTLKSPASGVVVSSLTPRLQWNASTGASDYGIQVSTTSTFAVLVVDETGITDLFYDVPPATLNPNTKYFWRVNASGPSGSTSPWSAYRYFKTPAGP